MYYFMKNIIFYRSIIGPDNEVDTDIYFTYIHKRTIRSLVKGV